MAQAWPERAWNICRSARLASEELRQADMFLFGWSSVVVVRGGEEVECVRRRREGRRARRAILSVASGGEERHIVQVGSTASVTGPSGINSKERQNHIGLAVSGHGVTIDAGRLAERG